MTSDDVKRQVEAYRNAHQPIDPTLLAAIERLAKKIDSLEKKIVLINSPRSLDASRDQKVSDKT